MSSGQSAQDSQAALSILSFLEGNFAIHNEPSSSDIFAFGRAPPKEEPGAIRMASHFLTSVFSLSSSMLSAACCNSRIEDQGGVGVSALSSREGPARSVLKRKAPIRHSS